jgi:hypothetical protein
METLSVVRFRIDALLEERGHDGFTSSEQFEYEVLTTLETMLLAA